MQRTRIFSLSHSCTINITSISFVNRNGICHLHNSPFDALKGFNEAVLSKDVLYEDRIELLQEDSEELSRRLNILHNLTFDSRMARENRVQVSVTYYEPCSDENNEAYGLRGQYKTITGICWNVDAEVNQTILIDRAKIPLGNVLKIEASGDLFRKDWDDPWIN